MSGSGTWVYRFLAALALGVGLGGATAALAVGYGLAQLRAESAATQGAAETVAELTAELRSSMEEAAEPSNTKPVPLIQARRQGVPLTALTRARDTGEPVLLESGAILVARYETASPPSDVASRRQGVVGVDLVPISLRSVLAGVAPAEGGVVLSGPERPIAQRPGPPPQDAVDYSVELPQTLAPDWSVVVWSPVQAVPVGSWLVAVTLATLGPLLAVVALLRARRARRAATELERQRRQHETLSELAAVSQQSLDLADVLPTVGTRLSDALGLRGLRLSGPTTEPGRALFVTGQVTDDSPVPLHAGRLLPGQTTSIAMARGGRLVAILRVTAGRELDEVDLTTLRGTAEVLTSALANADAYSQQRDLLQRMRRIDDLKTVFLATASHELRTPVGIINGFARLLATKVESLTSDQIAAYAERVEANARQLSELVENLLDFSRLERGVHSESESVPIDLGPTVAAVLEQHADVAPHHTVEVHAPPGHRVLGTVHAVERVVTNLVGNAGKYSPAGTTIRVRVQRVGERVELVVDDQGPGVPESERDQVFSRFFRGTGDAVLNTRGAGLGLAIVTEFAQAMRGKVSVTESPTGGARFVASYPAVDDRAETPAMTTPAGGAFDAAP